MATTTTEPVEPTAGGGFALDEERPSIYSSLRASLLGTGGDMGARPAIAGLIALFILFGLGADKFASKANFANLITQSTWVMILAVGVTFVLLLGEIDLSAGYTAGVCVVTIAWLIYQHDVSAWIAIPIGFMIGAAIGTLTGFLVAKVGIPAFVATLAFFLAWQGVVLQIAREGSPPKRRVASDPGTPATVPHAHRAGHVQRQQPALAGWLDVAERGVERRVQRVDHLRHRLPRGLAALTLALRRRS